MRASVSAGVELEYEVTGHPSARPLLLIMGLGFQLIHWDPEFCARLAERGFCVVRFDNRDSGLSTKIRGGPKPNVAAAALGLSGSASYSLWDMADDTAGLLDHLGWESAHIAGISMGGMIAQSLAIRHPRRVSSLASMLSTTGNRRAGLPRLRALDLLLRRAPKEREAYIEWSLRVQRVIGTRDLLDEERLRRLAGEAYDRFHYPVGVMRQLVAVQTSGDRTEALGRLELPTVVLHGTGDPLVPARAGRATAAAIPGARLVELPGMGHDLPPAMWAPVVDAIVENADRADAPRPAGALG